MNLWNSDVRPLPRDVSVAIFRLTVRNGGPQDAAAVQIGDTLPAGLDFVAASAGCTAAGQTVTCAVGALAAGESRALQITVRPSADLIGQTLHQHRHGRLGHNRPGHSEQHRLRSADDRGASVARLRRTDSSATPSAATTYLAATPPRHRPPRPPPTPPPPRHHRPATPAPQARAREMRRPGRHARRNAQARIACAARPDGMSSQPAAATTSCSPSPATISCAPARARTSVYGRTGNDRIYGSLGPDLLLGGPGNDRIFGGGVPSGIEGPAEAEDRTTRSTAGRAATAAAPSAPRAADQRISPCQPWLEIRLRMTHCRSTPERALHLATVRRRIRRRRDPSRNATEVFVNGSAARGLSIALCAWIVLTVPGLALGRVIPNRCVGGIGLWDSRERVAREWGLPIRVTRSEPDVVWGYPNAKVLLARWNSEPTRNRWIVLGITTTDPRERVFGIGVGSWRSEVHAAVHAANGGSCPRGARWCTSRLHRAWRNARDVGVSPAQPRHGARDLDVLRLRRRAAAVGRQALPQHQVTRPSPGRERGTREVTRSRNRPDQRRPGRGARLVQEPRDGSTAQHGGVSSVRVRRTSQKGRNEGERDRHRCVE